MEGGVTGSGLGIKKYNSIGERLADRLILWTVFGLFGSSPINRKDWLNPVNFAGIVSGGMFGDVIDWSARAGIPHTGIDLALRNNPDVLATAGGKVIFAGDRGPYGKSVIIEHAFGIKTYYNHLDEIFVEEGDISKGTILGKVGNTPGGFGQHLDYEITIKGFYINPTYTLPGWYNSYYPK